MKKEVQKLNLIGVIGNTWESITACLIKEMFLGAGFQITYINEKENIIFLKSKNGRQVGIIVISPKYLEAVCNLGINFQIVVHTFIDNENLNDIEIAKLFSSIKDIIIFNIDDENSMSFLKGNDKALVIAYGLNNKATITASSLDINNCINFNLCIQRNIITIDKEIIEPFDFPVKLNLIGKHNIYNVLAAISVALCYGIDLELIKKSLSQMKGMTRRLEKIYEGDFTIIDNFCSIPSDYNIAFEAIQNFKYKNIIIINGVETSSGIQVINKSLETMANWISVLESEKLLLFLDKEDKKIEECIEAILSQQNIKYRKFYSLRNCIEEGLKLLNRDDILLILGGENVDEANKIISDFLTS